MPRPSMAIPDAQKCLYKAHVRTVRGFKPPVGGQDCLGWSEGRRKRTCASRKIARWWQCNVLHSVKQASKPTDTRARPAPELRAPRVPSHRSAAFLDRDPAPESNVVLDLCGCVLRSRVVPRGVQILVVPDHDAVVARRALPRADGRLRAGFEVLHADGFGWEVMVSLPPVPIICETTSLVRLV